MVGDLPSGKDYFGTPNISALEDAVKAFQLEQAIVVHDRLSKMIRYGERKTGAGLDVAKSETRELEICQDQITRLILLWSTAKAILYLLTVREGNAKMHFPALRMKIPYAAALVLSKVGDEHSEIDREGIMTLSAFTEFHGYLKMWGLVSH